MHVSPKVSLIQLKTSLVGSCHRDVLPERRRFVTTTDIITLVALTVLFAGFAATMAWAETLTRRHCSAHFRVDTSSQRKKRPF